MKQSLIILTMLFVTGLCKAQIGCAPLKNVAKSHKTVFGEEPLDSIPIPKAHKPVKKQAKDISILYQDGIDDKGTVIVNGDTIWANKGDWIPTFVTTTNQVNPLDSIIKSLQKRIEVLEEKFKPNANPIYITTDSRFLNVISN